MKALSGIALVWLSGASLAMGSAQEQILALDDRYVAMGYPLFGSVLSSIGDVDADAVPDVVLVDPSFQERPSYQRRFWILSGKDGKQHLAQDFDSPVSGVSPAIDLDGDRVSDFLFLMQHDTRAEVSARSGKTGTTLWSQAVQGSDLYIAEPSQSKREAGVLLTYRGSRDSAWQTVVCAGKTGEQRKVRAAPTQSSLARAFWFEEIGTQGTPRILFCDIPERGNGLHATMLADDGESEIGRWRADESVPVADLCLSRQRNAKSRPVLFTGAESGIAAFDARTGSSVWQVETLRDSGVPKLTPWEDVDGDAVHDLLVTWPHWKWALGRIEMISGATGRRIWEREGPTSMAYFGIAAALVPDRDGDSVADVLVGCDNGLLHEPGSVVFVSGRTGRSIAFMVDEGKRSRPRRELPSLDDVPPRERARPMTSFTSRSR